MHAENHDSEGCNYWAKLSFWSLFFHFVHHLMELKASVQLSEFSSQYIAMIKAINIAKGDLERLITGTPE